MGATTAPDPPRQPQLQAQPLSQDTQPRQEVATTRHQEETTRWALLVADPPTWSAGSLDSVAPLRCSTTLSLAMLTPTALALTRSRAVEMRLMFKTALMIPMKTATVERQLVLDVVNLFTHMELK